MAKRNSNPMTLKSSLRVTHTRSLKLVGLPVESFGAIFYSLSIVPMALSRIVCAGDLLVENCEIFIPRLYLG